MDYSLFSGIGVVRTVRLVLTLFLLVLGACAQDRAEPVHQKGRVYSIPGLLKGMVPGDFLTDKADYPTADTADVYRAVLDTLYMSPEGPPAVVVLSDIATTRVVTCARMPCPLLPEHRSGVSDSTLEAYRVATLTRRHIRHDFEYHLPLAVMGTRRQDWLAFTGKIFGKLFGDSVGRMHEPPFWVGFMSRYEGAWGYATLSTVGMNPEKNEAVLQVGHICGSYCSSYESMVLRKTANRWQVMERIPEMSDSLDIGHRYLRYRGVGARKPNSESGDEIRARGLADAARLANAPRRISGKIWSGETSASLAGFAVLLHDDANPNVPRTTVYSNSLGEYRIENPPIGGTWVSAVCPAGTLRHGAVLSVAHTTVLPDSFSVANFDVDPKRCEEPAPPGQPMAPIFNQPRLAVRPSGLLTAAERARSRASRYPSDEEADVYTALLNYRLQVGRDSVVFVYHRTRSLCAGPACQSRYTDKVRTVYEVVLSTLENFLALREENRPLRPGFAKRPDLALVGDSVFGYVQALAGFSDSAYANNVQAGDSRKYWPEIHKAYPQAQAMITLSRVGFSPRHKQAIVEMVRINADGFTANAVYVLNKTDDSWRVVRDFYF